jgi:hypothetical protein
MAEHTWSLVCFFGGYSWEIFNQLKINGLQKRQLNIIKRGCLSACCLLSISLPDWRTWPAIQSTERLRAIEMCAVRNFPAAAAILFAEFRENRTEGSVILTCIYDRVGEACEAITTPFRPVLFDGVVRLHFNFYFV